MSANTALELEDVVFRYQEKGKRNILDHTSLSIPAGTLTVLMGGSGCGKSTLAAVAAGLYPENGGFLESRAAFSTDIKYLPPLSLRRRERMIGLRGSLLPLGFTVTGYHKRRRL